MDNEDNVIDAEIVDNLPAVIEQTTYQSDEPIEAQRDWPYGPTPERRCVAHKKTGERCKNAAILGTTVCRFHGGAAKHVKAAARARLENAADRMARNLLGLATEAESEPVRLGATNSALDRAGLKPPAEIVLSQGETKPWEEVYEGIADGTRAESRRARGFLEPDNVGYAAENAGNAPPTQRETGLPTGPPTQAPPADQRSRPSGSTGYEDLQPEYLPREDLSPTCQHRADPSGDASVEDTRGAGFGRGRRAGPPHITGQAALSIAADLAREQLALTSPHKRYKRP